MAGHRRAEATPSFRRLCPAMTEHGISLSQASPIADSVIAVAPVVPMPRAIAADLARPVIGPDHAAVAVPVAIIIRISVIARRVEAAMEVMPVVEVRPVIDVAVSVAHAAAAEHGRGTKAATMDRNATALSPPP